MTDNKIFGLDPTTGQVVRFNLTPATTNDGPARYEQADWHAGPDLDAPEAARIGHAGRDLGRTRRHPAGLAGQHGLSDLGLRRDLRNTPGFLHHRAGFDATALGSTDTLTVMGDVATNQLQMIDVAASLAAGTAQLPVNEPGYPPPANYTPPPASAWWAA